jgi:hypothetical protein
VRAPLPAAADISLQHICITFVAATELEPVEIVP